MVYTEIQTHASHRETRVCIYPSPPLVCYKLTPKLNEFEMIDKLYH